MTSEKPGIVAGDVKQWGPPAIGWIILNVGATITHEFSTLAVVAKDAL